MEPYSYLDLDFFEDDHHGPVIYFHDDYPRPYLSDYTAVSQRSSIFGANKQEEPSKTNADNSSSESSMPKKARSSADDIYFEDMDEEVDHPSASHINNFLIASSAYEENRESQEKDSGLAHSIDQPVPQPLKKKMKSTYVRKKSQPAKKKNDYKTKNLLSFLWTKTVNFLQENANMSAFDWWQQLKAKTGSRNQFNFLFKVDDKYMQECMQQMFNERYFYRMVMLSSINAGKKKLYIQYIRILYRCYLRKFMPWIN